MSHLLNFVHSLIDFAYGITVYRYRVLGLVQPGHTVRMQDYQLCTVVSVTDSAVTLERWERPTSNWDSVHIVFAIPRKVFQANVTSWKGKRVWG